MRRSSRQRKQESERERERETQLHVEAGIPLCEEDVRGKGEVEGREHRRR